ncbi:protein phosphatase 2C domain-containing protein [Pradoshia sp.]
MSSEEFSWVGSKEHYVDQIHLHKVEHVFIGRFGGNSSAGQYKNEDGCLIWVNRQEDWEFALLLDAHHTAESAEAIIDLFNQEKRDIKQLLAMQIVSQSFKKVEEKILTMFQSPEFLSLCQKVQGETACLIVVRRDKFIWWFSVGDCLLFLFHPELAALGQYQVNQRQFYEWIGQINTFAQEVPCYSVGVRELRKGKNRLFLTTDGLVECPNKPFAHPKSTNESFDNKDDKDSLSSMLKTIRDNGVRDSTTIITWPVHVLNEVTRPSNQ